MICDILLCSCGCKKRTEQFLSQENPIMSCGDNWNVIMSHTHASVNFYAQLRASDCLLSREDDDDDHGIVPQPPRCLQLGPLTRSVGFSTQFCDPRLCI